MWACNQRLDLIVMYDCWPLTKFWRTLVMFDHFWDFDMLVEGEVQGKAEIAGYCPLFRDFWV